MSKNDRIDPPAIKSVISHTDTSDNEAFIKSDTGWIESTDSSGLQSYKTPPVLFSEPIIVDEPYRTKQRKNRTRRSSVALRQDLRNALEMLYTLESVNLMDRPIIQLEKGAERPKETHHMGNVNIASLWRASARHVALLSEELEGSKGARHGEDEFDIHRHKEFSGVKDAKVCRCLFKDSIECQWNMKWGAYNRQCAFKNENQDGWAAVVPSDFKVINRFLSDRSVDTVGNNTESEEKQDFVTYNGISNYHAEAGCKYYSSSVLIPKIDATQFGSQASILEAQYLHSSGLAWPVDQKNNTRRTRRGSLHVIRQMLIGDREKDNREKLPDLPEILKSIKMSKNKVETSCWSLQSESGPLSTSVRITNQKAFTAEWQRIDAGANYPSKLNNGPDRPGEDSSTRAIVEDDVQNHHTGSTVSPLQPAVLICMDGHGTGGKLGVARAATTMAESLSLALSCISWLGGVAGFTDTMSPSQINEEVELLSARGNCDLTIGGKESFIFDGIGVNMNPKNTLCTCGSDAQILRQSTRFRASQGSIPTEDDQQMNEPYGSKEPKIVCFNRATLEATRQLMINSISVAFRIAHSRLLEENDLIEKDFGTTACAMAIAGRYLYAAWVGDSPGCLVAIRNNRIGVIRLTHEHCLKNIFEKERIATWTGPSQVDQKMQQRKARRNSRGHILETQHAGHRLIPEGVSYHESRSRGLSINMSRALGHNQLTYCALSPQPEFACIDLLYCLHRMKWFTGPKKADTWDGSCSHRLFQNANTLRNVELSDEAIGECSNMFHIKPDPSPIDLKRDRDELLSVSSPDLCQVFGGLELFVCAYTDGIGDCLNPAIVGSEIYLNKDATCMEIARRLTERAEEVRSVFSLNRDNCAMVVSKLKLDTFIPVTGKMNTKGSMSQ